MKFISNERICAVVRLSGLETGDSDCYLHNANREGTVVVRYADGSTSQADLGLPNWCCADPTQYGATTVATVLGKNTKTGPAYPATPYRVFANSVPLTAGNEFVAVTLHVFAASVA